MRSKLVSSAAVAALLFASACAPKAAPAPDMAAMQTVATAIGDDYMKAYAAKDAAAIANLFTEDGMELPGDTTTLSGRAALQASAEAGFASPMQSTLKIEGKPLIATADMLVSEGTYSVSIPMPTGDPFVMNGKWMSVSEHQADGSWKIKRLIHNLNSAARPAMPAAPAAPAKKGK